MESPRQRYKDIYNFERKNDVFPVNLFCWNNTYRRWIKEGLAVNFDNAFKETVNYFLGYCNQYELIKPIGVPIGLGKNVNPPWVSPVIPSFETKIVSQDDTHIIMIDYDGSIVKRDKYDQESMPQWLEYPVKNKKTWDIYKKRLNPNSKERYPKNWEMIISETLNFPIREELEGKSFEERDFPLGMNFFSVCGLPRDYMGLENFSMAIYDDIKLVLEMMDWQVYFSLTLLQKVLDSGISLDWIWIWEDIAYNKGSLFPPSFVKKHMVPRYKKVVEFLHKNGIYNILLDCDGNVDELLPLWVECGINGIYPLECASRMDGREVRKKFGENLVIYGNIDKMALAKGKNEIDQEIEKAKDLLKYGGYFPCVDHWVPPDVSLENIKYYFNELYKLCDYKEYTKRF